MTVTLDRIVADVRTTIGENRDFADLLRVGDSSTLTLAQLVARHAPAQAEALVAEAPHAMLEPSGALDADEIFCRRGWGTIPLPDDFLRLHSFRLDDWPAAVTRTTPADRAMVTLARCCTGRAVVADRFTPIVVVANCSGGRRLEFFCDSPDDTPVAEAFYCRRPAFDRDAGLEISPRLYDPLIGRLAELCATGK